MAGTQWPSLTPGTRARATDVEYKFDWIEGDIAPMSGGTKVDATYDIGTSSHSFRDGYFSRNITHGNGSVAAPSLTPASDPTTGRWYPAASTIAESVAGVEAMRIRSDGTMTRPLQCYFYAYQDTTTSNVTGDDTETSATITSNWIEKTDRNSSFDASTGIFTAPYDGTYYFSAGLRLSAPNTTTVSTVVQQLTLGNSLLTKRIYTNQASATATSNWTHSVYGLLELSAADTVYLSVMVKEVGGSGNLVSITGSTFSSYFSGFLL